MGLKNIFLIGGGEIAKGETKRIDAEIMHLKPRGSNFVFFGTAAGDSDGYAQAIESVFGEHFRVVVASEGKGKEFSKSAIENASVIYLGGGTTKVLMDHFENWELISLLKKAIEGGAIVAGMSAGAQALAMWYVHEEDGLQEVRCGWGLTGGSIGVLVHATEESFLRAKKLCKEKDISALYGVGEKSALMCDSEKKDVEKIGEGAIWE